MSTLAALGLTALLVSAGSLSGSVAHAAATRDIQLTEIDSAEPAGALDVKPLLIDAATQRGYAIDSATADLIVYGLAGGLFIEIATVPLGTVSSGLDLDESTHRVVVTDAVDDKIRVVDGDTTSPTVNTVLATYSTGGTGSDAVAVDSVTHLSYIANTSSNDVTIIDLSLGTRRIVSVGAAPNAIAVDPTTSIAFVASSTDHTVTPIVGGTRGIPVNVGVSPMSLTYSAERLLIGTKSITTPYQYTLDAYDSALSRIATSGSLGASVDSVSVDDSAQIVYVTLGNAQLVALRPADLQSEMPGSLVTGLVSSATVDPASHLVFTVSNTRARTTLISHSVQASPLASPPVGLTAQVGSAFSHVVDAPAIPSANQFTVTSGTLPPGLTLDAVTGEIHGTPTVDGSFTFAVTASNGFGTPGTGIVKIVVAPAAPVSPMITSGPPPAGQVGVAYSFTVTASGVPAPTFSVTGGLPAGLNLDPVTGVISGTPTSKGSSTFTITATNALDDWSEEYTVVIAAAAPMPTPTPTPTPAPTTTAAPVPVTTAGTGSGTPRALASTGSDPGLATGAALSVLVLGAGLVVVHRITVRRRRG